MDPKAGKEEIRKRLGMLRSEMRNAGVDYYLVKSTDPHVSEYVGDHFRVSWYLTGCTSDNVTLIVEADSAHLWTDGRYFISAALELENTGVTLMRSGQPGVLDVHEYLKEHLEKGQVLAFDGTCVKACEALKIREIVRKAGAEVEGTEDLVNSIWLDRPPLPCHMIRVLPPEIVGKSMEEKIADVRMKMEKCGAAYFMLSKLDDIMWLLNIRGGDVECNPVALSFLLLGMNTIDLFVQKHEDSAELETYAREKKIKLHLYSDIYNYLNAYHFDGHVMCDCSSTSDAMYEILAERAELIDRKNPTGLMKAVKNDTEIAYSREFYIRDSVALCRFIYNIKKTVGKRPITEWSAAMELDGLRREIPEFIELSFPTISAYNANAAMAHYSPEEGKSAEIKPEGFLLVDSGGQYLGATTDVTRTIALGPLSDRMREDFTLVAVSNLLLMYARFMKGTNGSQLDMIARGPLYMKGRDYNHGTGHGIGYILNVHEGPQRISKKPEDGGEVEFVPGMITSDEPGIYREGEYGIRTESVLLCVSDTRNGFGEFYRFEPLTFVPIDLEALDPAFMQRDDIWRLNDYHRQVREAVSPFLEGEELEWLIDATREMEV